MDGSTTGGEGLYPVSAGRELISGRLCYVYIVETGNFTSHLGFLLHVLHHNISTRQIPESSYSRSTVLFMLTI